MTAALPLPTAAPSSASRVRLASVEAREVLRFRFGKDTRPVPVLFAHQNFKDEKIQWPEKLLPVDITVHVDSCTLNFQKISFDFDDAPLKLPQGPDSAGPPQGGVLSEPALQEALDKCRKLIRKKILSSHYGCEVNPVKYPGDSEICEMEIFSRVGDLEIYRFSAASENSKTLEIFWRRFEWLMLFFVDATQHTEFSEARWEYYVGFIGKNLVLGISMYKFPVFPLEKNLQRNRIAQFLTIPSFWGKGHAEQALEILHDNLWRANNIDRLTLEDASEGMLALRNVVLLKKIGNSIDKITDKNQNLKLLRTHLRRTLKVSFVAVDRLIDTVLIANRFPDLEYESVEENWFVKENYIKRIKWMPEEVEAMAEGEDKEKAKREFFQEDWENYVETAFRAWKRVFKHK